MLETYLPPAVTTDELERRRSTQAIGGNRRQRGPKDMGKVMKAVMALLAGKTVDGKKVNEMVKSRLA